MYAFAWKNGHIIRRKRWYTLTSKLSLQVNIYMTHEDKFLLPMWWLLTRHQRWWLQMSLINQWVVLRNLTSLLKFASIEGFVKGTTLFWWPWRCTMHPGVIWIISSWNVLVFFMIDYWEIINYCIFAFNFSSNVLVLVFNML
jgi:hypothetical protein